MSRADHCPIGGEPCQSMCETPCTTQPRAHDPQHTYVKRLVGCGHGRLFKEPCTDCAVVGLMDEYRRAVRTIMRVRDRMRVLGRPMPGMTS